MRMKRKSTDALDQARPRRAFSKRDKQEYAKRMHAEELNVPPKEGLADFLTDPTLLPKKPPGCNAAS